MWFSFWKSRDRFSIDELRYLTDQLQKVQIVNEVNKDSVIEALRSIAELITYGDQHDSNFFEFFMEKQVMGEFVRILRISKVGSVSLQLLQTMSIMIQNLKSEHAIYYMFSNEHINALITYSFDFRNEELLSYYISFLRAISGKLNQNTISLLVKTQNDEVVSFPLYVEAIRFAFHEENMIRTAVRALTLNVYHVGDDSVNSFITKAPHADYFSNLVRFFQKQCNYLNGLVSGSVKIGDIDGTTAILAAVDEIEDNLFYFSDIISAGIPDVGKLITDKIMKLLILPLLLPSLWSDAANEIQIVAVTSLYLVCCILRILKIKDLANTIAAALFCPPEAFVPHSQVKVNGYLSSHSLAHEESEDQAPTADVHSEMRISNPSCSTEVYREGALKNDSGGSHLTLWDALLSYITTGDDLHVQGALCVLATLLQTKELDETMLDALGILPQRKHHKKLLLQVLVGEGSGEEQLFSPESSYNRDGFSSELDCYLQQLKAQYKVACPSPDIVMNLNSHRFQVLDALVSLFCRSNISAETLWDGGWLLRQLLPYSETEFNCEHLKLLKESYKNSSIALFEETKGIWPDVLITVLCDEWKKCKRAIESSSPRKEPKYILMPIQKLTSEEVLPGASSFVAGERMYELVKAFVLLHQLQIFSLGRALPEQPPIHLAADIPQNSRSRNAGLNASGPKPGAEIQLDGAMPCRIAFERGKERHFWFVAISKGISGWILLAEELPLKRNHGIVRVAAPLAGCNPRIDEKHLRWLHLRIRPSTLPFGDLARPITHGKVKKKSLVDGRWTLAFRDEESCKSAFSMILEEINLQSNEVGRRIKPLLILQDIDVSDPSPHSSEASTSCITPKSF